MESRTALTGLVLALLLCAGGCAGPSGQGALEVTCDEFMELDPGEQAIERELEVTAGASFTVTLCSNPSTGFEWEEVVISDSSVLRETGREFQAPGAGASEAPPPGAAGKEVWTFEAVKQGTSTVSMAYSRPWEGGEKEVWTFSLAVVVE